jgi:ribosome recycling factor
MMLENARNRMEKTIVFLDKQLTTVYASNKASLIDSIKVSYHGYLTSLIQLATISIPHRHCVIINPHDPSSCTSIEAAIQTADSGFVTIQENNMVRLSIPISASDHVRTITKRVNCMSEESKIAIRNIRRDVRILIDKKLSSDQIAHQVAQRDKLQMLTNEYIEKIDHLVYQKHTELVGS